MTFMAPALSKLPTLELPVSLRLLCFFCPSWRVAHAPNLSCVSHHHAQKHVVQGSYILATALHRAFLRTALRSPQEVLISGHVEGAWLRAGGSEASRGHPPARA